MRNNHTHSIIITADFKEKYIIKCIESCLVNRHSEIILVYYNLKNLSDLKKIFKSKIKFLQVSRKLNNPVQDQLYKIKSALNFTNTENIYLCDGDDFFISKKFNIVNKSLKKNNIILHDFFIQQEKKLIYPRNKGYKKNILFKFFFNNWPDKICTSCIAIKKKYLKKFFLKITKNYSYLAIDALLVIFYKKKIKILNNVLVVKNEDLKNRVDLNYKNSLVKYINRRIEQHNFNNEVHKENYSFEYLILNFFNFFLRLFFNKKYKLK